MFRSKLSTVSAFAAAIAVSSWAFPSSAPGGSLSHLEGRAQYAPIQGISYELGSKAISGYFVQQSASCHVTLMIIEKIDPEHLQPVTAGRLRLVLNPGQTAGVDSEEGRSLNLTCGNGAATLLVDAGERANLAAQQAFSGMTAVAEQH
jgi:hypothetical protein